MPIERASENVPAGAMEIVKAFLVCTLDAPNEAKARELLTKATLEDGSFHMPEANGNGSYVIGEETVEEGQIYIPVTLKDSATGAEMTVPLAPVQEEGVWKLDMGKMMAKMMGGAMGQMVEQVGDAMGKAMEGIGEAMKMALGGLQELGGNTETTNVGAAELSRLEKAVADINEELSGRNDLNVKLEVDAGSLLRGEDEAANKALLNKLVEEALKNFVYAVTEAHRQIPLEGRVKVIRIEGAREARDRIVYSEGARIIYRLSLRDEGGFYDGQELVNLFAGVAAGMAETALPGDVSGKSSYQPKGEAAEIVRDYQEFVVPVLMKRIGEMLGHDVAMGTEWDSFEHSPDDAKGLWTSGLNRICGALGILTKVEESRAALGEKIQSLRILPVPQKEMKSIDFNGNEFLMYFSPEDGEAGGFYEGELAELLSRKLKLKTRPMVAELERYAKTWEPKLAELFGVSIQYAFDWDGFTCYEEEGKNVFALTLLRENGIDWMYYALANLAEKNPNFRQQMPKRVRWIYLEHVPRAEKKGIRGEQTTLALKLFLHEGYAGYLTIKDLEKALPGIVAGMPDIPEEAAPQPSESDAAELSELDQLRASEEALAALREWIKQGLIRFSVAMKGMLGIALPVEMDWHSFKGSAEELKNDLQGILKGVLEAFPMAAQEENLKSAIAAKVDKLVVRQGNEEEEDEGFALESRVLTFTAIRDDGKSPIESAEALDMMREELIPDGEERPSSSSSDASGWDSNDRTPQPYVAVPDEAAEVQTAQLKAQFEGMLPAFAQQIAMILGKPIAFEIEWQSVKGGVEAMGQLLNVGLTPTLGGLALLANDAERKVQAHTLISKVVLRQAAAPHEHGFAFRDGTLTYSAAIMPGIPAMEPQLAAALLGTVLNSAGLAERVGKRSASKSAPKGKGGKSAKKKPKKK